MKNNIYHFISSPMPCGKNYTAEIITVNIEQACDVYFNKFISGHSPLTTREAGGTVKVLYISNYEYKMSVIFTPIAGCNNVYSVEFKSPKL